jgi:hypothetical protein
MCSNEQRRVKVFIPQWFGAIEGYTVNFLHKNHWKVARQCEWTDAMQEAYCVFLHVKRKYPQVNEAKHFMALYKVSLSNRFINLALEDTAMKVEVSAEERNEDDTDWLASSREQIGETDNEGALSIAIKQAPREIQMVLSLLLNAPAEILETAMAGWKSKGKRSAGGSKQIAALLGLPADRDVLQEVHDYFNN